MSGKAVCALRRECEGETPVLLLINTSEEKQTVTLAGTEYRSWEVADSLSVSGESASKVRSHVFVPPFSAAVLTPSNSTEFMILSSKASCCSLSLPLCDWNVIITFVPFTIVYSCLP
jgi:hypothetical protein